MGYQDQRASILVDLIENDFRYIKIVYSFFKKSSDPKTITDARREVANKIGACDSWKVMGAVDILEKSNALKLIDKATLTQLNKYKWNYD